MTDEVYPIPVYGQRHGFILVQEGTRETLLTSTITDGDTTHAPTGDAVFDALALKGTVTSVAVANATGITWTGSPITTSGTLTPTLSANLQAWSGVATSSKQDTLGYTPVNRAGDLAITGSLRTTGEYQSTNVNGLRIVQGNYGVFWRNDGTSVYLLMTASGDQYGSFNSLRPFHANLTTGRVTMQNGLTSTLGIAVNNAVDGGGSNGVRLWADSDSNWAFYVAQSGAAKSMAVGTAPASLSGRTGHHIRTRVTSAATTGFIWENNAEAAVMSLDADTGTLVTLGRQIASSTTFVPTTSAVGNAAMRTGGSDGGGFVMIDGATYTGTWTDGAMRFGVGTSTGLVERGRFTSSNDEALIVAGRQWFQHNATTAGGWYSTSANAKKWFLGVKDDATFGLYNTTNLWNWQVADDGRTAIRNANSATLTTQPRVFVQASDPGAAAADGDLWFW